MTHWKKLTNPNYLGSYDFEPKEERILTIEKVVVEQVIDMEKGGSAKKDCIIAHFKENCKPMILNKTNCKMIQTLYDTPMIEQWAGKRIIVRVEKVKAFGKLEDALRIKKEVPKVIAPQKIMCEDCKKEVVQFGNYTPQQIAAVNQKKFGRIICATCSSKLQENKGENKDENN